MSGAFRNERAHVLWEPAGQGEQFADSGHSAWSRHGRQGESRRPDAQDDGTEPFLPDFSQSANIYRAPLGLQR